MKTRINQIEPELIKKFSHRDEQKEQLSAEIIKQRERFQQKARCYKMCADEEIIQRENRMDLDIFQEKPNTNELKAKWRWMV